MRESAIGLQGWLARAQAAQASQTAAPQFANPSDPSELRMADAMLQTLQATTELMRRMHSTQQSSDQMSLLAGSSGDEHGLLKIPGARGAAVQELFRRDFARNPGLYSSKVRANIRAATGDVPWSQDESRRASAYEFLAEQVPFPEGARTLIHFSFGIARAFDQMTSGKWHEAEDTLAKLLVFSEQTSRDGGDMRLAWLLTHLPEPPWSRLLRPGTQGPQQDFAQLSEKGWVAAAIGFLKDAEAVKAMRGSNKRPPPADPNDPTAKKKQGLHKAPKTKA